MPDFPGNDDSDDGYEVGAEKAPVNESESVDESQVAEGAETPADAKPGAISGEPKAEPNRDFSDVDPHLLNRIWLAEQQVQVWDARISAAKATLKDHNEARDEATILVRSLIREMKSGEPNLFSGTATSGSDAESPCEGPGEPISFEFEIVDAKPGECPLVQDETWKAVPLSDLIPLGAPEIVVQRLGENGVNTLGEFSAWGEPNAQGYQKTIDNQKLKGCGAAKREKFEQALEKFWTARTF